MNHPHPLPPNDPMRRLLAAVAAMLLGGCISTAPPTATEMAEVRAGGMAIVLLRVRCTIDDQRPYDPFRSGGVEDNVSFGLGSFETAGEPVHSGRLRYLSGESRQAGWTYLVLPHGTHYLVACPPRRSDWFSFQDMMKKSPRLRIDVPAGAQIVYAGTLQLHGQGERLLAGGKIMNRIDHARTRITNEQQTARELARRHFPDATALRISIMQRHSGPVILSMPVP